MERYSPPGGPTEAARAVALQARAGGGLRHVHRHHPRARRAWLDTWFSEAAQRKLHAVAARLKK